MTKHIKTYSQIILAVEKHRHDFIIIVSSLSGIALGNILCYTMKCINHLNS